jgi:hypothetical protein
MGKLTKARLLGPIIAALLFVGGFVVNLTSDLPLYNADLNVVGDWQQSLNSAGFMDFMNVVSNIFNPVICAGYVALFWIVSSRKLEIMTFLVWFIFLSWLLTILKSIIQYVPAHSANRVPTGSQTVLKCSSGPATPNSAALPATQC